jgi:FkbM family methyltransferase
MGYYENRFIYNILKSQLIYGGSNNPYEQSALFFWDSIVKDNIMHINKVKLPDIRWFSGWDTWPSIYADSLLIHHLFNDDYSEENVTMLEDLNTEGPYGYENVIVEPGDVVIDAGAFIGDWSAVASVMGGEVYAFDASPNFRPILLNTAKLNNFQVFPYALGDTVGKARIDTYKNAGCETMTPENGIECDITTIDQFAQEKNKHIDFIKSDIEGFERYMLMGAKNVLKNDAPKLAIKTYHYAEDRFLLPKIIKESNPKYKIINRARCLYAYV